MINDARIRNVITVARIVQTFSISPRTCRSLSLSDIVVPRDTFLEGEALGSSSSSIAFTEAGVKTRGLLTPIIVAVGSV